MSSNLTLYQFEQAVRAHVRALFRRARATDVPFKFEALPSEKRNAQRLTRKGQLTPGMMAGWMNDEVEKEMGVCHGQA